MQNFELTDFIEIKTSKSGKISISFSEQNKKNMHQYLFDNGIRGFKLNNKSHFLQKVDDGYKHIYECDCGDILFKK